MTSRPAPPASDAAGGRVPSAGARGAASLLIGLHVALALLCLRDPLTVVDNGYHAALGRLFAEQGIALWDPMNYAPGGRPNLSAPLLPAAIGVLGRLLGGEHAAYAGATVLLGVLQWIAAMLTVWWFAWRLAGDRAALLAVAALSGGGWVTATFLVGIPSGWMFILTPWAIHSFLGGSLRSAAVLTAASIYAHVGGYAMAPLGIAVAALATRRWRDLVVVGATTAVLTLPYSIHLLLHVGWFAGYRGHVAWSPLPFVAVLGLAGLVRVIRHPRRHALLVAWAASGLVWLLFHPTRLVLQSALCAAVLGALLLDRLVARLPHAGARTAVTALALAVLASEPGGVSSLWSQGWRIGGFGYPRHLDWREVSAVARALERSGLSSELLQAYNPSWGSALGAFVPLRQVRGHWVEVRPDPDPAEALPVAARVHLVPVPPEDPVLVELSDAGLLRLRGGAGRIAFVALLPPESLPAAAAAAGRIMAGEARWLAEQAENNVLGDPSELRPPGALAARRVRRLEQQVHAGRLLVGWLVYLNALEQEAPEHASHLRGVTHGFGSLAAFLGDEWAVDFVDEARHRELLRNLGHLATNAESLAADPLPSRGLLKSLTRLFEAYFWAV